VANAYSRGGIPLNVQGVANVKVASHEPVLGNAVTRFLDYDRKAIVQVVKDTLEGNLRGVLSQLTPEQVNEDKLAFAEKLLEEAEHDLSKLGLVLDTLKIQNVSDDKGYLTSIGRKQSADLIKRSRVAEANAKSSSGVNDAGNRERARVREIESRMEIVRAETERRIVDTLTRREALIAEEVGRVQAAVAKAEGELKVYEARVEQARRQLEADVIEPANAEMEAHIAEARGAAARIIEDGKATAEVLGRTIEVWQKGGPAARDILLMQKLESTLGQLTSTIDAVKIDRITVLPAGQNIDARKGVALVEELKGALGVDLPALARRIAQAGGE
jgi:flotillin